MYDFFSIYFFYTIIYDIKKRLVKKFIMMIFIFLVIN